MHATSFAGRDADRSDGHRAHDRVHQVRRRGRQDHQDERRGRHRDRRDVDRNQDAHQVRRGAGHQARQDEDRLVQVGNPGRDAIPRRGEDLPDQDGNPGHRDVRRAHRRGGNHRAAAEWACRSETADAAVAAESACRSATTDATAGPVARVDAAQPERHRVRRAWRPVRESRVDAECRQLAHQVHLMR